MASQFPFNDWSTEGFPFTESGFPVQRDVEELLSRPILSEVSRDNRQITLTWTDSVPT